MSPSPKGRVLGPISSRTQRRSGTCAWCGEVYIGSSIGLAQLAACARCGSEEIDWDPPPAHAEGPHSHVAATHTPGTIAFSMLGGFVRGARR